MAAAGNPADRVRDQEQHLQSLWEIGVHAVVVPDEAMSLRRCRTTFPR